MEAKEAITHFLFYFFFKKNLRQHSLVPGKINQGDPYRPCRSGPARGVSESHTWCGVVVNILIVKSLGEVSWPAVVCLYFPLAY